MNRFFITVVLVCFAAVAASAQTKTSGTAQCAKPDPQHMIPVGDLPDHALGVEQTKCTWTKPMEIAGAKSKDGVSTGTDDASGNTARTRGFHVSTMDSGDKFFSWYQGTATMKDGALVSQKGNWGFTGGTGKLKGIKGKGTYTCAPSGDGSSCEVEGDYQLAK
jgi:hypothetical protein